MYSDDERLDAARNQAESYVYEALTYDGIEKIALLLKGLIFAQLYTGDAIRAKEEHGEYNY